MEWLIQPKSYGLVDRPDAYPKLKIQGKNEAAAEYQLEWLCASKIWQTAFVLLALLTIPIHFLESKRVWLESVSLFQFKAIVIACFGL